MSNILNYKFYLNFKNEDSFGRIEITEPIGFDGASFVVEQDNKRYGRDVYRINEEINLNFYKGNYDVSTQQQLPNGTVIYNLTQGYDYLIDCFNRFGFESDVDFEIELNDIVFIPSNLDFQTSETDDYSYFSCKAVQVQGKQLIKRRSDIVTNIFSTEDLDGNEVTPAQTQNILLKAKPTTQESEWLSTNQSFYAFIGSGSDDSYLYQNTFVNSVKYGIEDSLNGSISQILPPDSIVADFNTKFYNFGYVNAQQDLTNVVFNTDDVVINYYTAIGSAFTDNWISSFGGGAPRIELQFRIYLNGDTDSPTPLYFPLRRSFFLPDTNPNPDNLEFQYEFLGVEPVPNNAFNITGNANKYRITIPNTSFIVNSIPRNYRLCWSWYVGREQTFVQWVSSSKVNLKAISTAIDSVIKGVRYIDVFKENIKRINGFTVDAQRYDVDGEYYNQFAFTGNLIKQRTDLAFPVKFKEITDDLSELNSDYQILNDKVYIGQYQDFYTNKEIGAFVTSPDDSFKSTFNSRYAINEFEYKYKTYEQDREEENTKDAIHTESQWLVSNKQVENTKTIDIGLIRDAYKLESARRLGFKTTTSTSDDDKMFVLDVVNLAPNSRGGFRSSMRHNIDENGRVQLLKDADLPSWSLLGFGIGDEFKITSDDNEGTYEVFEIEDSIITLEPITPSSQSFSGVSYTTVDYPYTNVLLTNRTNEGLIFFDNILNGDNYANLRYSIKRNIEPWKPYLSTASKFSSNGTFKNTYFKDNGICITQFEGESEPIQEDADIINVDLGNAFLTPYLYETRLLVPFNDMSNVLYALNTINSNDSIGGFIRCIDNKGKVIKLYPSKLEYIPSTETLTLTGEERNEGNGVDIVITGDEIFVNEVGYDIDELSNPFYEYDGDYFKIYDVNKLPIINPTKYTDITVNGNTFNSASDLLDYLINN
jgi:hypothetical protein